jgi:hypothetical protein
MTFEHFPHLTCLIAPSATNRHIVRSSQAVKGGQIQQQKTAGPQHTPHFSQCALLLHSGVVQHVQTQHHIEGILGKRQVVDGPVPHLFQSALEAVPHGQF